MCGDTFQRKGKLLLFYVGLALAFSSSNAYAGHVTFFINLLLQNSTSNVVTGEENRFAEMIYENISERYPDSNFVQLRATTPEDLKSQLSQIVNPSTVVDALVVISHGTSDIAWIRRPGTEARMLYYSWLSDGEEDSHFSLNITDQSDVTRGFGPIVGRFADHSSIVFMSCDLLQAGILADQEVALKQVADNFGQGVGDLYMNQTSGNFYEKVVMQPLWAQDPKQNFSEQLIAQITMPEILPIALFMDRFIYNQGYRYTTLAMDSDGKRESKTNHDRLFNALTHATPAGAELSVP